MVVVEYMKSTWLPGRARTFIVAKLAGVEGGDVRMCGQDSREHSGACMMSVLRNNSIFFMIFLLNIIAKMNNNN